MLRWLRKLTGHERSTIVATGKCKRGGDEAVWVIYRTESDVEKAYVTNGVIETETDPIFVRLQLMTEVQRTDDTERVKLAKENSELKAQIEILKSKLAQYEKDQRKIEI